MVTKSSMTRHQQTGCVEHFRFFWGAGQTSCFMSKNEGNQVVVCDVSGVNTANPDWVTTWIWSWRPWAWRNTKNVNHIDSIFLLLICCIRKITIRWTRHGFTLILVMIWHQWLEHEWFWQKMIIRVAGLQGWRQLCTSLVPDPHDLTLKIYIVSLQVICTDGKTSKSFHPPEEATAQKEAKKKNNRWAMKKTLAV